MPFRTKAKNLFSRKKADDSLSISSTNESNHEYYGPDEIIPPPKYRRPPQKEHTEKLEAFSFTDAWRKKSFQSSHSPMGTRASSRRQSMRSLRRRDFHGESSNDWIETQTNTVGGAVAPGLQTEEEAEGDDDDTIVGLSKHVSKETTAPSRPKTAEDKQPNGQLNGLYKTMSTAHDHTPFSEHDIAKAMQRSQMVAAQ